MKNDNSDLLDLCRLNLMEEAVEESPANDRNATLQAIDWQKRQLIVKLKAANQEEQSDDSQTNR